MLEHPAISVAAIIATAYREDVLRRTLLAVDAQTRRPDRIIIIDATKSSRVETLLGEWRTQITTPIEYKRSEIASAAVQRNQGAEHAKEDVFWFLDDDLYPDRDCLERVVELFGIDPQLGGVGILLKNELAQPPRARARRWFSFLAGDGTEMFGGRVIGPAVNFYVSPTEDGRIVDVDWLNIGCTFFRREAFNAERFSNRFVGYSFMEDVDVSLRIARNWRLKVHTGVFGYHDSQPSAFKSPFRKGRMNVTNRYYVMSQTMGKRCIKSHAKFFLFIAISWAAEFRNVRSFSALKNQLVSGAGHVTGIAMVSPLVTYNLLLDASHGSKCCGLRILRRK